MIKTASAKCCEITVGERISLSPSTQNQSIALTVIGIRFVPFNCDLLEK